MIVCGGVCWVDSYDQLRSLGIIEPQEELSGSLGLPADPPSLRVTQRLQATLELCQPPLFHGRSAVERERWDILFKQSAATPSNECRWLLLICSTLFPSPYHGSRPICRRGGRGPDPTPRGTPAAPDETSWVGLVPSMVVKVEASRGAARDA
eukprot:GHVU01216977.1.p1 GENE.GHVU01216977.1~~GHVU01216977.1.p1  ORF type:complete len:152 (-),score=9.99 GHVU01216977.1:266-721(-)